ncbi:hypothetical protein KKG83_04315 [Candidatus Micrarchaeota archaeon]|nr:hypothetical protein [Candidatus Micrarchaeota archaeon]MBU2476669.1 hypothetical protein [Candidatus Micrarchaeota archaeon]
MKKKALILLIGLTLFFIGCVQPDPTCGDGICQNNETVNSCPKDCLKSCENKCSETGIKQCIGNGFQVCGNYNEDSCLGWNSITACPEETKCKNGECMKINQGPEDPFVREKMIWDLPELYEYAFGGEWHEEQDYTHIDLRYISPEDNDQHSEFAIDIYNSSEKANTRFDHLVSNAGNQWDVFIKEINGNKIFEGTSEIQIGKQRYVFWISGSNILRGWNGNDLGTVIDDELFDVLTKAYLEKYPSTYD